MCVSNAAKHSVRLTLCVFLALLLTLQTTGSLAAESYIRELYALEETLPQQTTLKDYLAAGQRILLAEVYEVGEPQEDGSVWEYQYLPTTFIENNPLVREWRYAYVPIKMTVLNKDRGSYNNLSLSAETDFRLSDGSESLTTPFDGKALPVLGERVLVFEYNPNPPPISIYIPYYHGIANPMAIPQMIWSGQAACLNSISIIYPDGVLPL